MSAYPSDGPTTRSGGGGTAGDKTSLFRRWRRHWEKPTAGPVTLGHDNIYVLPNRRGWSFAGLGLLLFLVSLNYGNNLSLLLTCWVGAIWLASAVQGQRNLYGLVVKPGAIAGAFAGEVVKLSLILDNPSARRRFALRLRTGGDDVLVLPILDGGTTEALSLAVRPTRRGWYTPDALVLESGFPLGMFRVWSRFRHSLHCLVYPAPAADPQPFPLTTTSNSSQRTAQDDLAGFRPYQAGDPLRQVHWKAYAAGRGLHTRLYAAEDRPEIWLDWEAAREVDTEMRLSRLCRWVLDADGAGLAYGLRLPGKSLAPSRGPAHRTACLEALALFGL